MNGSHQLLLSYHLIVHLLLFILSSSAYAENCICRNDYCPCIMNVISVQHSTEMGLKQSTLTVFLIHFSRLLFGFLPSADLLVVR